MIEGAQLSRTHPEGDAPCIPSHPLRRRSGEPGAAAAFALLLALALAVPGSAGRAAAAACGTADAALNRPATASTTENAAFPASAAVDGDSGTRWSSAFTDPQWLQVDLGSSQEICQVVLTWEAAYGKAFQIQVSGNASDWTSIYSTTNASGGTQTLDVTGEGRYVRMYGTARGTQYGYSLFGMAVHTGSGGGTLPGGGDLGPNVLVFDPSMSASDIQGRLDTVFREQESDQFGTARYALLFKPGSYNVNANIGFYTSIARPRPRPRRRHPQRGHRGRPAGSAATPRRTSGGPPKTCRSARPAGRTSGRCRRRRRSGGSTSAATSTSPPPATAGRAAATSPTRRWTARCSRTPSSSGSPGTAGSAATSTASGTWCSPASRARPRRASRTRPTRR
ncbi:discoidin domain-containing protein [Actinomadura madurae]|uniref:discoidin domain-containing protein n=1 Tax=Actinomadura madurae TaxID=1993 RepID=UPI0020D234EF|nr:discoidin domain-containing protein [Actinomadura madurae]MCP9977674.1 discoidin domain-containing protein [Actinomadura madurae]